MPILFPCIGLRDKKRDTWQFWIYTQATEAFLPVRLGRDAPSKVSHWFSNRSAVCKMIKALPFHRWNYRHDMDTKKYIEGLDLHEDHGWPPLSAPASKCKNSIALSKMKFQAWHEQKKSCSTIRTALWRMKTCLALSNMKFQAWHAQKKFILRDHTECVQCVSSDLTNCLRWCVFWRTPSRINQSPRGTHGRIVKSQSRMLHRNRNVPHNYRVQCVQCLNLENKN